jgi:hypothetical protein
LSLGDITGDSLLLRDGDALDLAAPLVLRGIGLGVNDGARPAAVLGHYGDDGSGRLQRPWVRRAAGASAAGPVLQFVDSIGVVGLEVSDGNLLRVKLVNHVDTTPPSSPSAQHAH